MMSGAPTGRVTALVLPARTAVSVAGWCAASGQPPHESVKNALSDHLLSRVRQPYVRGSRRTRDLSAMRKLLGAHGARAGGPRASPRLGVALAVRRHRRAAAAGLPAVPSAVLRQHRRPAGAADDQRGRRRTGVRADAVLLLRRPGRRSRAGPA